MEFIQGQRTELKYHEMTPLDKAINEYQRKADEYFKKQLEIDKLPPDIRNKRQKELDSAKRFLEHQRMNAESYAQIQAGLDKYREEGKNATQGPYSEVRKKQQALIKEAHHPTSVLAKMLIADGRPKPSSQHAPHHLAPGIGKTPNSYTLRVHLHFHGIRINDPDNGVWLPMYKKFTPHWSMPEAKGHLEYHTKGYEQWLARMIMIRTSEHLIRMQLRMVADLLTRNALPDEARRK
ncbi:AHH domain-containing protein [Agarilytica rhodophyticola]|uniref:AHH domain-containing protein n=1 Tax=Agarilytica rhodophyticola TaxID=1737490 RepID=UPI000B3438EF|nr:AHH domain-containing protein [Agarilytica rhodophyticola]